MADQTQQSRRKLLKSIAVGGGVFTTAKALPEKWARPVVESVILPTHAAGSPGEESAVYAVEKFSADGFSDCETLTVCAIVNGDTAEVRHQAIWDAIEGLGSFVIRTGTIPTDGSPGDMVIQDAAPGCVAGPDVPATITNLTADSLTYTLDRPRQGDLVAVLNRVSACPAVPDLYADCSSVTCPD